MTTTTPGTTAAAAAGHDSSEGHPRILLMLDLSTAHLPQELAEDLSGYAGVTAHELPYGWLLYVPEQQAGGDGAEPPAEVLAICRFARAHGCAYVLLDRDAETVADLPTWDW